MKTLIPRLALAATLGASLAGCASYEALPLTDRPVWHETIPHLQVRRDQLAFPSLPPHRFDPGPDGLDMTDVAILAVVNNPDLRLARDDAGIARAQAFSASLLPDPQLALGGEFKREPDAGATTGYTIGPTFDFSSLIGYRARKAAGRRDADKADLNLLWQEWQVIAQSRVLVIRIVEGQRLLAALNGQESFLAQRVQQVQQALAQGWITVDVASTVHNALLDVRKQLADVARAQNQARHDLGTLLGLAPTVQVPLKDSLDLALPPVDARAVAATLAELPARRPDLLALKRGYQAQDARYRAAILGQFPALNIGFTQMRDTSNTTSRAFAISLGLPVFNGNRGNIAIEKATRQRLHDEYQQRVNAAYTDVDRLLHEQDINRDQLQRARDGLAALQRQRDVTRQAFAAGNLDALLMTNTETALLARQTEVITLEQSMLEQRVALSSVLGGALPVNMKKEYRHE